MAETPRQRHLRVKYGITEEQFKQLHGLRDGACWICHKVPKSTLQVDHQHNGEGVPYPGRLRGLLCWRCNRGLDYHWTRERLLEAWHYMDPLNWPDLYVPVKKKRRKKR